MSAIKWLWSPPPCPGFFHPACVHRRRQKIDINFNTTTDKSFFQHPFLSLTSRSRQSSGKSKRTLRVSSHCAHKTFWSARAFIRRVNIGTLTLCSLTGSPTQTTTQSSGGLREGELNPLLLPAHSSRQPKGTINQEKKQNIQPGTEATAKELRNVSPFPLLVMMGETKTQFRCIRGLVGCSKNFLIGSKVVSKRQAGHKTFGPLPRIFFDPL